MDAFKIAKGIDELIYDIMIWIIFFPYTLGRILHRPLRMMHYVSSQLERPEDERFANSISPALFLFLAILLGWALAPIDPNDLTALGEQAHSDTALLRLAKESATNLIIFRLGAYCSFPLIGALIYEWRTPGGINRESFQLPVFQQCYITGPMALAFSVASTQAAFAEHSPADTNALAGWMLLAIAGVAWGAYAQFRFFRSIAGCGFIASVLWATFVIVGGFGAMYLLI